MLSQIGDRIADGLSVFLELADGAVAALTQDRPHLAGEVIVVHMNCGPLATDGAEPALLLDHPVHVVGADSVLLL